MTLVGRVDNKMHVGSISYATMNGVYVLRFCGEIRVPLCADLNKFGDKLLSDASLAGVVIDLIDVKSIDSTALGLLVKIAMGVEELGLDHPLIISTNANVNRTLEVTGFQQIFHILDRVPASLIDASMMLSELPSSNEANPDLCGQVLEAHRILMGLNERNERAFKPVVNALEREQSQSCKP
ncbi:MAG: STAS domain-containing protein [Gammaproteobacteria bacterium]|nr:STAS domain-containing protein [Gammaproteobacteria bacterium]